MRRIGLALLTVLSLSSVGCPSPSIYGTARTTPPKRWSHTIAAEGFGTMEREFQGGLPVRDRFVATPTMPTYQLRYGLAESADVGFRVANLASAGLDVKFCFLKDAVVDLAIDPMAQIGYEPAFYGSRDHNRMYLHLPFIV